MTDEISPVKKKHIRQIELLAEATTVEKRRKQVIAGQQTATLHVAYGSLNMRVVRLYLHEALDVALTLVAGQTLRVTLIYTAHTRNAEGQHAGV